MDSELDEASYVERSTKKFNRIVFALFLGGFATFALLYCVQPMLPFFSSHFSISATQSSLILSVATIFLALGLLFTAPISDAIGRKPIMMIGLFGASISTFIGAISDNFTILLISRAFVGLSLSGLTAITITYLNEEISKKHIGTAIGLCIGGNALGGMGGRVISGVLIDFFSWHVVLIIMSILAFIAALLFLHLLPSSRHFVPSKLNFKQTFTHYNTHLFKSQIPCLMLESFLIMGAFVVLFNYIGYRLMAEPYLISQTIIGFISIMYISGMYSSTQFGIWSDRFGPAPMLIIGILIMIIGMLLTFFNSLFFIILGILLMTFGFFGAHSVASGWVGKIAQQGKAQASSLYLLAYYTGSSVLGTSGGFFWNHYHWQGIAYFNLSLLCLALMIALYLRNHCNKC